MWTLLISWDFKVSSLAVVQRWWHHEQSMQLFVWSRVNHGLPVLHTSCTFLCILFCSYLQSFSKINITVCWSVQTDKISQQPENSNGPDLVQAELSRKFPYIFRTTGIYLWFLVLKNHKYIPVVLKIYGNFRDNSACTKSGPLEFSGCWLILSVCTLMSFAFPFGRLLGVR
jgi:hypothetical protein